MAADDYPIGYGKPPKHTQFKPGQSGNPKGRPKGTANLATDLEEELSERILVTEGGKQSQITKQRAMLKTLFAKALKGDTRAASVLLNLIIGLEQARSAAGENETLSEEDQAILASYQQQLVDKLKSH
jgi:hypothetical protein